MATVTTTITPTPAPTTTRLVIEKSKESEDGGGGEDGESGAEGGEHVAAVNVPKEHELVPDTVCPESHVGWHVDPCFRTTVNILKQSSNTRACVYSEVRKYFRTQLRTVILYVDMAS